MGWEKLPVPGSGKGIWYYLLPGNLRVFIALAVLGVAISLLMRFTVGLVLGGVWVLIGIGFVVLPEARLWNARLLPFLYLSILLLSAIAVGMVIRAIAILASDDFERPARVVGMVGLVLAGFAAVVMVGLPMASRNADGSQGGVLPFATRGADGVARFLGLETTDSNAVSGWAQWNFTGLQGKQPTDKSGGWPEYHAVVDTMAALGKDPKHGCGRAMWEYDKDRVEGYGTPMALMLMPYFTDGCIGSQEGLYFESSTTVPYHFLMQSELSDAGVDAPARPAVPAVRHDERRGAPADDGGQVLPGRQRHRRAGRRRQPRPDPGRHERPVARVRGRRLAARRGPLRTSRWSGATSARASTSGSTRRSPGSWTRSAGTSRWLPPARTRGSGSAFDRVDPELAKLVGYTRSQTGRSAVVDQLPDVPRKALPKVEVTDIEQGDDEISFDVDHTGVPVVVQRLVLPELERQRRRGPVAHHAQPHGRGADVRARHADLRASADRLPRLRPDRPRRRRRRPAGVAPADRDARIVGAVDRTTARPSPRPSRRCRRRTGR